MKSNVILKSTDRVLFCTTIRQETKNSFLSVSDLQKSYETARWQYGWNDRRLSDILNVESTKERIYHLLNERNLIKTTFPAFMEMVDKEGITKVLKGLGVYKTTGRGENKTTMADPYIWTLLAMELNPLLYAKVIIWLTDSLVFDRLEAGREYMPMNASIKSLLPNPDYIKFENGGRISTFIYDKNGIEISCEITSSEHAKTYNVDAEKPLYLKRIYINKEQRNKGKGKEALMLIEQYAKENNCDVIFGYVAQKAEFSSTKNKPLLMSEYMLVKGWLNANGYEINKANGNFYKRLENTNKMEKGG